MMPFRRLALVQASRALRPSTTTFRSSFHSARVVAFPIPTSTDNVNTMDSRNTAGQGLNEKGSGNLNTPNEHNVNKSTSNSGRVSNSTPVTPTTPPSSSPTEDVSTTIKRGARKASAKVQEAASHAGESVRHTVKSAGIGMVQAKEDLTHAVNTKKTRAKSAASQAQADLHAATAPASEPMVDVDAVKRGAQDTADSVKQGLSSAFQSVKSAAQGVAEAVKSTTSTATAKARDTAASTSDRLSSFGERMEAKFEKLGDDLMKSGEAIERRNQEPDTPPQPLPLDEVDHMPNPKNLNDVLPGTGSKDTKRNDVANSRDRGQFPG